MIRTVEAVIETDNSVRLLEEVRLPGARRALVTILEDAAPGIHDTALLSERAFAGDWGRPEEEEAWSHLQPVR